MSNKSTDQLKQELISKLDELKAKMEQTDQEYEAEVVEYAKKYSGNLESPAAVSAMQKLGKKYAEIFAEQEDEIKVVEGLLVKLDDESYE